METTHGLCHECNLKLYPAKISSLLLVPQASAYTAAWGIHNQISQMSFKLCKHWILEPSSSQHHLLYKLLPRSYSFLTYTASSSMSRKNDDLVVLVLHKCNLHDSRGWYYLTSLLLLGLYMNTFFTWKFSEMGWNGLHSKKLSIYHKIIWYVTTSIQLISLLPPLLPSLLAGFKSVAV